MSERRRTIAAAPVRGVSQAWSIVSKLVVDTLARAQSIDASKVDAELRSFANSARILIAGGHLATHPLVLVAASLHLTIETVSGDDAFEVEENLNAVPGAASADDWKLHLAAPDHLQKWLAEAIADHPHLTVEEPPVLSEFEKKAANGPLVDMEAFARLGRG
jgi:hypothetical protein